MSTLIDRIQLDWANCGNNFFKKSLHLNMYHFNWYYDGKKLTYPHEFSKIGSDMKSLSVTCFYFIFFFQATQSIVWSVMHYIYFRFWISVIHCMESFVYFRFFFVLGLAEKLWESHHNKLLLMKINEKIVSNSENNHHRNYEIYFLPRIITQCLSASSEAQVPT